MEASYWGAIVFGHHCGLIQEALDKYDKTVEIGEKVGDCNRLAWVGLYEGALLESVGRFEEAVNISRKGLKCAQRTDSYFMASLICANMVRVYVKLADLPRAQDNFDKLANIMKDKNFEIKDGGIAQTAAVHAWTKAVFFVALKEWDQANQHFLESINIFRTALERAPTEAWARADYACFLTKIEKNADSQSQIEKSKSLLNHMYELQERLDSANLFANLIAPRNMKINENSDARIDLINISKKPIRIVRIDITNSPSVKVFAPDLPTNFQDGSIILNNAIEPFQVKTIKLILKAESIGVHDISLEIFCCNDVNEPQIFRLRLQFH